MPSVKPCFGDNACVSSPALVAMCVCAKNMLATLLAIYGTDVSGDGAEDHVDESGQCALTATATVCLQRSIFCMTEMIPPSSRRHILAKIAALQGCLRLSSHRVYTEILEE